MKDAALRRSGLDACGLAGRPAFFLHQVHGSDIVPVRSAAPFDKSPDADGWITDVPGPVLCVFTADCVPLYVWDKEGTAVGAFHAGWRGLAKGMPRKAVAAFGEHYGIAPERLRAVLGPHIKSCCYRVSPETAKEFRASNVEEREGGLYLDLTAETVDQLKESGVHEVDSLESGSLLSPLFEKGSCTGCDIGEFFSYRREKSTGSLMSFITIDPA